MSRDAKDRKTEKRRKNYELSKMGRTKKQIARKKLKKELKEKNRLERL